MYFIFYILLYITNDLINILDFIFFIKYDDKPKHKPSFPITTSVILFQKENLIYCFAKKGG